MKKIKLTREEADKILGSLEDYARAVNPSSLQCKQPWIYRFMLLSAWTNSIAGAVVVALGLFVWLGAGSGAGHLVVIGGAGFVIGVIGFHLAAVERLIKEEIDKC